MLLRTVVLGRLSVLTQNWQKIGSPDTCHNWNNSFRTRRVQQNRVEKFVHHAISFVQDRATYE